MKILIVDNHVLLREGLGELLRPLGGKTSILGSDDLDQAFEQISQNKTIDLIILNLNARGVDGVRGLSALADRAGPTPIVVLGAPENRDEIIAALESGARGYVPHSANGRLLVSALKLVLEGETYVPSLLLSGRVPGSTQADVDETRFPGPLARLSGRQREVFEHLARGLTNAEIATVMSIEINTVKNHVKAILKILGVANRTQAVAEAARLGYRRDTSKAL